MAVTICHSSQFDQQVTTSWIIETGHCARRSAMLFGAILCGWIAAEVFPLT